MSDVPSLGNPPTNLVRVRDINWADPNISRAAIIPIHYDGTYRWIGLGITTFSTSLSTIGGSYEDSDHDLLATAIREYNEEIGPNTPELTAEAVFNCYALKTNYSIEILFPFKKRIIKFTPTDELINVIWITPTQLQAINTNHEYIFPETGKTRAYVLSGGLRQIIPSLIEAVNNGRAFTRIRDDNPFPRVKRVARAVIPRISRSIEEFELDAELPNNFKAHMTFVVGLNLIGIMREDRTVYILPISALSRIVPVLNTLGFKVIVTSIAEYKFLTSNGVNSRIVASFQHIVDQFITSGINEIRPIRIAFNEKVAEARTLPEEQRALTELALLMDYEAQSYELVQEYGIFANPRRKCYLFTLKSAIDIIARTPLSFDALYRSLKSTCQDISVMNVIITALKTGIFIQDPGTTIMSMK